MFPLKVIWRLENGFKMLNSDCLFTGIYSVLGDGEWVMHKQNISIEEYNKLATFFNPTYFNADEWVLMAKNAGMKYITITSRHHDGFSMFESKASNFNIVEKTPYGKDILKMLTDACNRHGLKIFFYYSQLDWYRDDYFPRGKLAKESKEGMRVTGMIT